MQDIDLFKFYNLSKEMNILLQFKGALSQEILMEISDIINSHTKFAKSIKNSFAVFVELSQNIMKYSSEIEVINTEEVGVGIILFIEGVDFYQILAGNQILNKHKDRISKRLDIIKSATEEELKVMYKEQRRKEPDENSKGAGLGFIDIARKSDIIDYEMCDVDDINSFLIIKVGIIKEHN